MPNKHLLHKNSKDDFIAWLVKDGWEIEEPKGEWEAIMAKKPKRRIIVYNRLEMKEHLTVRDCDTGVVRAYFKDKKENAHEE